jgi:hypothetical protein
MKLKQLLESDGKLIGFGYETIKNPYSQNINFYPEIYNEKKLNKSRFMVNPITYLVPDFRGMKHWNRKEDSKVFDIDMLESNWAVYSDIRKHSTFYLTGRATFESASPAIHLGKTFLLGKVHRSKEPNLYLNHFNLYVCSMFFLGGQCVYVPFKVKVTVKQTPKRKTVQEFYESVDNDKLLDAKVFCTNIILPNIPLKDVRPIFFGNTII